MLQLVLLALAVQAPFNIGNFVKDVERTIRDSKEVQEVVKFCEGPGKKAITEDVPQFFESLPERMKSGAKEAKKTQTKAEEEAKKAFQVVLKIITPASEAIIREVSTWGLPGPQALSFEEFLNRQEINAVVCGGHNIARDVVQFIRKEIVDFLNEIKQFLEGRHRIQAEQIAAQVEEDYIQEMQQQQLAAAAIAEEQDRRISELQRALEAQETTRAPVAEENQTLRRLIDAQERQPPAEETPESVSSEVQSAERSTEINSLLSEVQSAERITEIESPDAGNEVGNADMHFELDSQDLETTSEPRGELEDVYDGDWAVIQTEDAESSA